MLKKAVIRQERRPVLTLFADSNFVGRFLRFRGNLGVRSLSVFNFNDLLSSFRLSGNSSSTLVLFADDNYQGNRRIFRGPINDVSFLSGFNDVTSSFILSRNRLSNSDIDDIQDEAVAPANFGEVINNGTVTSKRKPAVKKPVGKK
ncbi:hypothetical protein EHS13_08555 [Paenibacillus psychroresistens]|uniref:Uncharacterized protein n=1 Tax=Paenibacillus psychroresistens TaxID=1778678 RepID=A0A6B8RHS3_9BACL|nr:hypothetical protein [Paenibacillus psychroresistens]QGQ94926.1 hypothetical protein EHS13_08555 [Paenibacillus psychroresistens]